MTSTTFDAADASPRPRGPIVLRYAGEVPMSGALDRATGEMTWSTELQDAHADGTFAVVDGVVLVRYVDEGHEWLRIGSQTYAREVVAVSLEPGLSACELVLAVPGRTVRLRADGDPAAEAFAVGLAS